MKVEYKTKSIEKVCKDAYFAELKYGSQMAEKIQLEPVHTNIASISIEK